MRTRDYAASLIGFFLLCAVPVRAGERAYRTGVLVDIVRGDQQTSTSYINLPPQLGGTQIPLTITATKYRAVVLVDDVIYEAETDWDREPKGFVINDSVRVRFSNDGEKLYLVSPNGKEYKTKVLRRQRAPSAALGPVAIREPPAPPPAPPARAPSHDATSAQEDPSALRRRCDAGDSASCNNLGVLYMQGRGVPNDPAQAVRLYEQACAGGTPISCANLGDIYFVGRAVAADPARAADFFRKACNAGELSACAKLGHQYAEGFGVPQDGLVASINYRKACDGGDPWGCWGLCLVHSTGDGVPYDPQRAAELCQQACEAEVPGGCLQLGLLYDRGTGVPKNEARAAALYDLACGLGLMAGCHKLAVSYRDGTGVGRDLEKAAELLQRACSGGDSQSCSPEAPALDESSRPAPVERVLGPLSSPPPAAQGGEEAGGPTYRGLSAAQWRRALTGPDASEAMQALHEPSKEALPVLVELLKSDQSSIRQVAATGLGLLGQDAQPAVTALAEALDDSNLNVRYWVAETLGSLGAGAESAVAALILALGTHPSREPGLEGPPRYYKDARMAAALALGKIGQKATAALPALREALQDEEEEVRSSVRWALEQIAKE